MGTASDNLFANVSLGALRHVARIIDPAAADG